MTGIRISSDTAALGAVDAELGRGQVLGTQGWL